MSATEAAAVADGDGGAGPEELRSLAALVDELPSVARRSGGPVATAATYLPGERILGLRGEGGHLEVHVVLAPGATVAELERDVRGVARSRRWGGAVDVVVEDVELGPAGAEGRP